MPLGHCGAGKRTRGRADECLTPRAGQSWYRRIRERELTRTVMQRRQLTHPTRRQMHCSAPAPACGRLVDIRVMHVQPVAPSTGWSRFVHGSPILTSRWTPATTASERLRVVRPPAVPWKAWRCRWRAIPRIPRVISAGMHSRDPIRHRGVPRAARGRRSMDGCAGLNTPDGVPIRANFKAPIAYRRGRGRRDHRRARCPR